MTFHCTNSLRKFTCLLMAGVMAAAQAQQSAPAAPAAAQAPQSSAQKAAGALVPPPKAPSARDRRRAVKLYLTAAKHYEDGDFEQAWRQDADAAKLDPTNRDYALAAEVARSHAVTALLQQAAHAREQGDSAAARAAIEHAAQIDPQNPAVAEHLDELANYSAEEAPQNRFEPPMPKLAGPIELEPQAGRRSFHLRTSERQLIQTVFRTFGIEATLDDSVRGNLVRFDIDDASYAEATQALGLATGTFFVPIDAHRVLAARDDRAHREQFERTAVETIPLSGMSAAEITEMGTMARTVFQPSRMAIDQTSATLTLRAPVQTIEAFNATYRNLMQGRAEVLLEVKLLQLAHTYNLNTGAQLPQTITAFNVYAEEQSILNANQALVQQIISSGLAAPGDTLAILGILLASGQVSSSLFSNGIALFGGGLTLSGISPGPTTFNVNLNSSDSRELDDYRLRLLDGEEGTLKSGSRYPITASSYSSLGASSLNIPGLTGAGTSGSLSSILASLQGGSVNVPMVQYQDLGVVFKARPTVLRSGEVALSIDLKISSLAGPSLNGVPVLANRSYSGSVRLGADQSVVLAGEIDKNESRAISGLPGLSEIPGLNDVTEKTNQENYATLLIIVTPHVVRIPWGVNQSPMVPINSTPGIQ